MSETDQHPINFFLPICEEYGKLKCKKFGDNLTRLDHASMNSIKYEKTRDIIYFKFFYNNIREDWEVPTEGLPNYVKNSLPAYSGIFYAFIKEKSQQ